MKEILILLFFLSGLIGCKSTESDEVMVWSNQPSVVYQQVKASLTNGEMVPIGELETAAQFANENQPSGARFIIANYLVSTEASKSAPPVVNELLLDLLAFGSGHLDQSAVNVLCHRFKTQLCQEIGYVE